MSPLLIYWLSIVLMMVGLYTVIARDNLVKKIMGLNLFQVAVIMFYVSMGKIEGGTAPILGDHGHPVISRVTGEPFAYFSNPLPHVLMLTAIVVGVATTALGLALVVRIKEEYGTVEEDEIVALDHALDRSGSP
jgi:multicomponent Na+:H+ antiporter subunit C